MTELKIDIEKLKESVGTKEVFTDEQKKKFKTWKDESVEGNSFSKARLFLHACSPMRDLNDKQINQRIDELYNVKLKLEEQVDKYNNSVTEGNRWICKKKIRELINQEIEDIVDKFSKIYLEEEFM